MFHFLYDEVFFFHAAPAAPSPSPPLLPSIAPPSLCPRRYPDPGCRRKVHPGARGRGILRRLQRCPEASKCSRPTDLSRCHPVIIEGILSTDLYELQGLDCLVMG